MGIGNFGTSVPIRRSQTPRNFNSLGFGSLSSNLGSAPQNQSPNINSRPRLQINPFIPPSMPARDASPPPRRPEIAQDNILSFSDQENEPEPPAPVARFDSPAQIVRPSLSVHSDTVNALPQRDLRGANPQDDPVFDDDVIFMRASGSRAPQPLLPPSSWRQQPPPLVRPSRGLTRMIDEFSNEVLPRERFTRLFQRR